jgi:branched-chain amino acid transport system ATP-binding protein
MMLSIADVESGYGKKRVLHGLTMQVDAGEVVSLLGRNGMGKTTSLRTIMGINRAWSGRIEFCGTDITAASPQVISQLGLGYVPEGRGIFPNLTVYENLAMSARPGRWTYERVYALFPRLKERLSHWGNELSGGEQQMLAIGRALLLNPNMVMLDEVMEGLAPLVQQEIWACLQRISEDGIAILVIDKNVSDLLRFAHRHYVMQKGEICWTGTSVEFKENREEIDRYVSL